MQAQKAYQLGGRGVGGTQQTFKQGGSAPRSNPHLYTTFHVKENPFRIPSIDTWYPFHIPV